LPPPNVIGGVFTRHPDVNAATITITLIVMMRATIAPRRGAAQSRAPAPPASANARSVARVDRQVCGRLFKVLAAQLRV
jgi:hypothetical protein